LLAIKELDDLSDAPAKGNVTFQESEKLQALSVFTIQSARTPICMLRAAGALRIACGLLNLQRWWTFRDR
jgi:hypothetical protein